MDIADSPPLTPSEIHTTDYITVVSVGSNESISKIEQINNESDGKDYITVLKIGSDDQLPQTITEEVLVYRLPGEKLGFGLKFEGGTKSTEFVKRLFIQSCAVNSPASRVQSLWGSLVEGDEVLEIDSVPVNTMTRIDCVRCLKDSNVVIKLLIKHRFDDKNSDISTDETRSRSIEDLPLVISAEKKRAPPPPPPVPPRKINRKSKENVANIVIPPKAFGDHSGESNTSKQNHEIATNNVKNHRLQSPYNSFRKQHQSPEVMQRVRRTSGDMNCPPDAEVYIDLFSQESAYSLSESDDTGSSISTIVDKLGSYPATTNSSFAGSLPSTPTPIQRQIYLTEDFDFNNDNYLFSKLITSQAHHEDEISEDLPLEKDIYQKASEMSSNESTPLQPPANFQDAPLSYGNEDVKIVKSEIRINLSAPSDKKTVNLIELVANKPPSPPPRTRSQSLQERSKSHGDEEVANIPELPRLVDFVPKSNKNSPVRDMYATLNSVETLRRFLENEKYNLDYVTMDDNKNHIKTYELDISVDSASDDSSWDEESEFLSLDWSPPSKLATIGEDEEDMQEIECHPAKNENLTVIIENADAVDGNCEKCVKERDGSYKEDGVEEKIVKEVPILSSKATSIPSLTQGIDVDEIMDGPRQPPDGHEFPDQEKQIEKKMPIIEPIENVPQIKPRESWWSKHEPQANSVRDKIAIFSKPQTTLSKRYVSTSSIPTDSLIPSKDKNEIKKPSVSLFRNNSIIDSTSTTAKFRTTASITPTDYKTQVSYDPVILRGKSDISTPKLHSRSISLLDISDNSNKLDKWNLLIEQRSLSKLKGLVIPEHEPETDGNHQPFVDLPEIQSIVTPVITRDQPSMKEASIRRHSSTISNYQFPQPKEATTVLPKYSPAFKRRSFRVHPSNNITVPNDLLNYQSKNILDSSKTVDDNKTDIRKTLPPIKPRDFSSFTITSALNDPPKSLESITSPTRSDYSFEFNNVPQMRNSGGEFKLTNSREKLMTPRSNSYVSDMVVSSEYDSDTDSALSSSQSSYLSKTSPPASPIHIRSESLTDVQRRTHLPSQIETPTYDSKRLLKPQSLEAINRKNILASAKCRSGRDLKVGSPLIRRKFEDNEISIEEPKPLPNGNVEIKPVVMERQFVKEKQVVDPIIDATPKTQEMQNQVKSEVLNVPKAVVRDVKNILTEKAIEPSKRNFATSGYYTQSNPVMRRASSVTDLRKNFEKTVPTPAKRNSINVIVPISTPIQPQPIKRTSLPQITPLAPVTIEPVVKPTMEHENVKDNADDLMEDIVNHCDEPIQKSEIKIVRLKPDVDGGSIGITLAGGADYETKEITIHKIREASPAFRDGRLQKGDKILAINGKYMKGLSHAQSLKTLKEHVPEVVIIACKGNDCNGAVTSPAISSRQLSLESTRELTMSKDDLTIEAVETTGTFEVSITKDATGLGFSIQGGKGSPQGDIPLVIKKIFMGGAAEKAVNLRAGDELLEVNHTDVTPMSRMEAWNLMKRLPEQEVIIKVRR